MGGFGGGDERQARQVVTDQRGVQSGDAPNELVVLDSDAEIIDLLGEGPIEGIVSGVYSFSGIAGYTGYFTGETFTAYTATGLDGNGSPSSSPQTTLGFLRSIYWNNTPIVDQNGYYNFTNINLEYSKGLPEGNLAQLNSRLPASETLDLTVERQIGERLYGVSIQGGTVPSATQTAGDLADDSRIDTVAKTYSILNNECTKAQLRVRVSQLFEQIRSEDAPKDFKKGKNPPAVGYGDIKAREISYNIYYQPIFDFYSDEINGEQPKNNSWTFFKTETIQGHIDQIYVRSTTIDFSADYVDQPGFAGWKIKVIRTTPESLTAYLKNVSFVDSIVEIYGTKLRYPYSTMVYSKFDAEFFSRVPERSYDTKLIKVKIPNNYNPILKTYGRSDAIVVGNWPTVTINTPLKKGQLIYFRGGQILEIGVDYSVGTGTITNASTWIRDGWQTAWGGSVALTSQNKGQRRYPNVSGEVGASTEGWLGVINGKNHMGTAQDNYWDGGFKEIESWQAGSTAPIPGAGSIIEKRWTDNPAWCFYDLITNPRYGLGDFVDSSFVDKWALYEIAQYCDGLVPDGAGGVEPRFTMNHIITSREEAYKVINDLSSIFRGIVYYANGLVYAVQDAFKTALYQFNNANVVNGDFNYSSSAKKARHSVAVIRYIDKFNLYNPSVEYVENEESVKRYGIRQIETTALGCTSRGQARRFGEWLLASEAQETESVTFNVGQDGAYLRPGDIVQIYDQFRTPLNFRGRTNAVTPLATAPSNITYPYPTAAGTAHPVTGNSVIIDGPVSFTKEQVYKFSLLTPTYNYESTGITNLNSDDEIRRSSVQNLYFLGNHTRTISGYYNSDYQEGGSGVVTQIYFHTGLRLSDGNPIGTGNQLDFDNYVITGYTNEYVNGSTVQDYSGGCFSGANLVWSAEVNDPASGEYVSGHFSNFRIINVTENDDSASYAISALAYSTGKYDEVENRLAFENISIDDVPLWPHQVHTSAPKTGVNEFASIILGSPNDSDREEEKLFEQYSTFEIRVPQASTQLKVGTEQKAGVISHYINTDEKYTLPKRMSYQVCVFEQETLGNGFGDSNLALSNTLFTVGGAKVNTIFHEVSDANYKELYRPYALYTMDGDPSKKASSDGFANDQVGSDIGARFFLERLLTKDTNYWFAVFAFNNFTRSHHAIVGLILGSDYVDTNNYFASNPSLYTANQIPKEENFNLIQGIDIESLTSPDLLSAADSSKINDLNGTEPVFNWNTSNELDFRDDFNKPLPMPVGQQYRITIRNNGGVAPSDHNPASNIFVEITGYDQPDTAAGFAFIHEYNSPHVISNLADTLGANDDVVGYKLDGNTTTNANEATWLRVDKSGIIFRNTPNNFPLREFDLVVEAHDGLGRTSAGNQIWNNTIRGEDTSNNYSEDDKGKDGYDFLSCSIGIPSGVVFAQYDRFPDQERVDDYSFITQGQAHLRKYPYLATADVYTNGELHLKMTTSQDAAGNTILTEEQLRNAFPDVRGLVYYYSTGDNSIRDEIPSDKDGLVIFEPNNKAPSFTMQPDEIAGSKNFGIQGNVKYTIDASPGYAQYPQSSSPAKVDGNAPDNVTVYRYYHLFDSSTNPANIVIPFPKIAASNVQNIYLTVGLFDTLSYLEHFNSDNTPKTKTVTPGNTAKTTTNSEIPGVTIAFDNSRLEVSQVVPTILLEQKINFSTLPNKIWDKDNGNEPVNWTYPNSNFAAAKGTPIFLKESSLQTKGQSALAYRAWWDITIDPGEGDFQMDFTMENNKNPVYRGAHKLDSSADDIDYNFPVKDAYSSLQSSVQTSLNKNKFKGINKIDVEIPSNSFLSYGVKRFPERANLIIYFDQQQDPNKYTVDIEFKGANVATAQALNPNNQVVKITDGKNDTNINPNARDLVTNELPLENCKILEKSRDYVKVGLGPFYIQTKKDKLGDLYAEMEKGNIQWVLRWYVINKPTISKSKWTTPLSSSGGKLPIQYPDNANDAFWKSIDVNKPTVVKEWVGYREFMVKTRGQDADREEYEGFFGIKSYFQHSNGGQYNDLIPVNFKWRPDFYHVKGGLRLRSIKLNRNQGEQYDWSGDKMSIIYPEVGPGKISLTQVETQVANYLDDTNSPYNFVGNIIKIKGGILQTDTFDVITR